MISRRWTPPVNAAGSQTLTAMVILLLHVLLLLLISGQLVPVNAAGWFFLLLILLPFLLLSIDDICSGLARVSMVSFPLPAHL